MESQRGRPLSPQEDKELKSAVAILKQYGGDKAVELSIDKVKALPAMKPSNGEKQAKKVK